MGYDIFKDEVETVARAAALLEKGAFADPAAEEHFTALLADYQKLLKNMQRLMRLADRNEAKLTTASKALDEKNRMLENLSGKLSRYLSPQIYNSIFSGDKDVTLSTERKKLTVFFSDIVGFTQTTDDMQPEDLTWLLNTYLTEMSGIALAYGATVDKFIGDAMLMFFGDPQTLGVEEDARACLRMALAMQNRMAELETQWLAKGVENPLRMRIGVNTGYCNVGNFGSAQRMDYTIIGGEVNLAARLEASADPGGILMSYETYALVQDLVAAEEREPLRVKGIRREVRSFAVTGVGDACRLRYLTAKCDGLDAKCDLTALAGPAREEAIAAIEGVIENLRAMG
ncbi:MAG: adenylate/guanylate cyclase domain-containing protein [Desulfovibrionaceae bacterium]|nr:adenylate/guanylate cyclase domain-containing protein [Desulfovibrionaceae bacterium]